MRLSLCVCVALPTLAAPLWGGDESLREKLKDLEVGDNWIYNDWPRARELAAKTGKPLFALFR